MFDPKAADDDKLRTLREDFEACVDFQEDGQREAHRAARFYHNTNNEGQWEAGDLEYLRKNQRIAFTFNLIKPKVATFLGIVKEQRRKAKAAPSGGEDQMVADVLNTLSDRAYELAKLETNANNVLKDGTIHGEKATRIEVETDPENPLHQIIIGREIPYFELHWDTASRLRSREDARFVFWDKWLSKTEFERMYPGKDYDEMVKKSDAQVGWSDDGWDRSEDGAFVGDSTHDMYDEGKWGRYYYDDHRDKIRVVHAEYRVPETRHFLVDEQSGITEKVSKKIADSLEEFQAMGALVGLKAMTAPSEYIHSVQFVAGEILFDDRLDQPYDGFSFVPFTFDIDSETGLAYGFLRNLFDPQMETNKSHSLQLEQQAGQSKPGILAEQDSIPDVDAFEDALKTTSSVAFVAKGALTANTVQERTPAVSSSGASQRFADSVAMMDKVSNINTDETTPGAQQEAYGTVALRHRKSQLSTSDNVEAFEEYKKGVMLRVLQTIIRSWPDSQISEYLGNQERYVVQGGTITEIDTTTGQPKAQVTLEQVRTLRYDVSMQVSSENTSARLMEAQAFASLQQMGFPVDPVVMVEAHTENRAHRQRLTDYAEKQGQAQSESAQADAQRADAQMQQTIDIAAGDVQEKSRHNQASELLDAMKIKGDHEAKILTVWEKADETEKRGMLEFAKMLEQRQARRESILTQSTRTGG